MVRSSEEMVAQPEMVPEMSSQGSAPVAPPASFEPPPERNMVPAPAVSAERNLAATVPPPPPSLASVPVAEIKEAAVRNEPVRRSAAPVAVVEEKAEERFGPRVDRLRQASTVVLDEAADDPEIRFLLVAAFLFILFLLVLIITSFIK